MFVDFFKMQYLKLGVLMAAVLICIGFSNVNSNKIDRPQLEPFRPNSIVAATVKQGDNAYQPTIWPTVGDISSGFGKRLSPFNGQETVHDGIDIANSTGTPVVATAAGTVIDSGVVGGYGNTVTIDHGNGIVTLYGHASQLTVAAGQKVAKGDVIALMGSSGRSTGPHLHYEVRVQGKAVEPSGFMGKN